MRKPGYSSAVHEVVDRLFVYGSLRTGQHARSLIADHVARWEPARVAGTLVAFPDYPGMIDTNTGVVHGELVWLTGLAAAFALLDAYEGDDFIRVLKKVSRDGTDDDYAWVYVLADPRLAEVATPVPEGDWAAWLRDAQVVK